MDPKNDPLSSDFPPVFARDADIQASSPSITIA
ncbi:hypothetical protein Alg130_01830 [Pyrenophora tritici-repentis]|uniref:Uncharacterized protein n=1 Tax=Pyrenophora tritici-repentis TaxID=45151 RepID=A0A922NKW2_9PLEO|nr:hypothetical protein Alg130_01830 [Pyrenophora tritici-repentis]KAI1518673.1 hypothetical protein Ptr86124_001801 [Pyrenophora tritici-repentis]KAI1672236.1 hypothetical protein L13192_03095 [Pyrenophora tritici-repentis]KAI1686250.1 hypothetical protein KJE20_04215 [Pyrenophora tritici-repentis]